ncbi:paraquat-inducible A domain protein, partial [Vibrio parahaemolyticus VPTS-2010_2]|jgi:hypothetical protein
MTSLS